MERTGGTDLFHAAFFLSCDLQGPGDAMSKCATEQEAAGRMGNQVQSCLFWPLLTPGRGKLWKTNLPTSSHEHGIQPRILKLIPGYFYFNVLRRTTCGKHQQ